MIKREPFTLWNIAQVKKHRTFKHWADGNPKLKSEPTPAKVITTFIVGLKPNWHQKQVLNKLIRLDVSDPNTKDDIERRPIRVGSFRVSKQDVRLLTEKDTADYSFQSRHIAIMVDKFLFLNKETPNEFKFIKLSSNVFALPPFEYDVAIVKKMNGNFALHIPCDSMYTRSPITPKDAMCGIDPGIRTFATIYDLTEQTAYQVGTKRDTQHTIPDLQSKINKAKKYLQHAIANNHKRAIEERTTHLRKLQFRLEQYVFDVQRKLASHLVTNYSYIALGKLEQPNQSQNPDQMYWNHSQFRRILLHRAKGTTCKVVIQDEAFTSKTCAACGSKKKKLGSSVMFKCDFCTYSTHRDINGARNIILKSRKMFPFECTS